MWKQKIPVTNNVTANEGRAWDLWFQVQHSPFSANIAFACKTETLGFLYSHALMIQTKSSKSNKSSGA